MKPNINTYNAVITACAKAGKWERAEFWLEEAVKKADEKLNIITYTSMLQPSGKLAYHLPGVFITHFCGNEHRKALRRTLEAGDELLEVVIPAIGVRLDVLSGAPISHTSHRRQPSPEICARSSGSRGVSLPANQQDIQFGDDLDRIKEKLSADVLPVSAVDQSNRPSTVENDFAHMRTDLVWWYSVL